MYLAKKAKSSNKEKATDIPSWAKGINHVQARVVKNLLNELWTNDMEKITIEQDLVQSITNWKNMEIEVETNEKKRLFTATFI